MRKVIIAGNWKMNKTVSESVEFIEELKKEELDKEVECVVCAPFISLERLSIASKNTAIKLGAQNVSQYDNGAYTGEISTSMLKDLNMEYVILGHSERRQYFLETNEVINQKVQKVLSSKMTPILCVGETLEERESRKMNDVIATQIKEGLANLSFEQAKGVVVAYEPIWAIGTGKTATSDQANEMAMFIRKQLRKLFQDVAEDISILYGGSVKPNNIKEIMVQSDIDGALVGGAALKVDSFAELVNYHK
ncbi:triose-phosphate isomerase [Filifactor alocis ATCC 35896]|uniref:Triosephosphate isomerase n=1 Tax=Filifactor alocis (strain ATCC 35896 / CCUG 47790 / D40 B5) TaxID=546269 RepID=D6GSK7_FILAD|nr:triose-phosphate isomerase [Filifactor alocis]EFE28648.1 triose-phosphate isomerase [Filifactor alocis ATCC 35896]